MAVINEMTEQALIKKLESVFSEKSGSPVRLEGIRPLLGGACQDNFQIDLTAQDGVLKDVGRLVLRSDAPLGIPRSLRRNDEFSVMAAAYAGGVLTPRVYWVFRDLLAPGKDAYLMDWCDGVALGSQVLRRPQLADTRAQLPKACADELAKTHRITPKTHPELLTQILTLDPVLDSLHWIETWLGELKDPYPAMEFALAWMKDNPPTSQDICLVHGDFRTGNLLVTPEGLAGVLDWEFAHWGCPEEDLAWISVRDWRFGQLDRPIGGFGSRDAFYQAYERASGKEVLRSDVHFWEVFGNVRWAAGCVHQATRYLSSERCDIELLSIGRRVAEMEYEALRLIEVGHAR